MDQLNAVLGPLKKYLFWILCGLVIVLPVVASLAISGQIGRNVAARKGELEGAYKSVADLETKADPPNEKAKQVVVDSHKKLVANVFDAWKLFYDKQPTKAVNWPPELGAAFLDHIAKLGPNDPIDFRDCETYRSFISRHIPVLMLTPQQNLPDGRVLYVFRMTAEEKAAYERDSGIGPERSKPEGKPAAKADAKAAAKTAAAPAVAAVAASGAEEPEGIIEWVSSNEDLHSAATAIGFLLASKRPTSSQVRYAQEDLWVIEAVLKILENTNKGATSTYNAPVKRIRSLKIGADAAIEMSKTQDRVVHMAMASVTAKGSSAGGRAAAKATSGRAGGESGAGAGLSDDEQKSLALRNNRYVDQNGVPLAAGDKPPFAEFKMMPVYMELGVDQRALAKLLVECAHSSMPVVVRRVAIRPDENKPIELASLTADARGGGVPQQGGVRVATARAAEARNEVVNNRRRGPVGGGGTADTVEVSPDEMTVHIEGIIYIFNPPQMELIGTGAAAGPSQPAASPDAGPTGPAPTGPAPAGPTPAGPATPAPAPTGPAAPGPAAPGPAPTGPATPAPTPPAGPPSRGGAPAKP